MFGQGSFVLLFGISRKIKLWELGKEWWQIPGFLEASWLRKNHIGWLVCGSIVWSCLANPVSGVCKSRIWPIWKPSWWWRRHKAVKILAALSSRPAFVGYRVALSSHGLVFRHAFPNYGLVLEENAQSCHQIYLVGRYFPCPYCLCDHLCVLGSRKLSLSSAEQGT